MPSIIRKALAVDILPPSYHTILIASQSPTLLKIMQEFLKDRNIHVLTTNNPLSTLTTVAEERLDLILLGLHFPAMDGYRICQIIRSNLQFRNIPIVVMGPPDGMFDKMRARLAGATDFLETLEEASQLLAMVEKYLPATGIS